MGKTAEPPEFGGYGFEYFSKVGTLFQAPKPKKRGIRHVTAVSFINSTLYNLYDLSFLMGEKSQQDFIPPSTFLSGCRP